MNKKILAALLVLILCVSFAAVVTASSFPLDVGNHNDYDYDYDYDSGGSFGGSYSSSSSDSGDIFILIWLFMKLPWPMKLFVIIAIIVAFILFRARRRAEGKGETSFGEFIRILRTGKDDKERTDENIEFLFQMFPNNNNKITEAIKKYDPNFNEQKFLSWTREVFITLQQAWTAKDWTKIRPFEKEELFRQHSMQLQEYINLGRTNYIERIGIDQAYLFEYRREQEYEHMKVFMSVRMTDYILDDRSGKLIMGSQDKPSFMRYVLTFIRKTGVLTDPANSNKSTNACPHCGAPTEITSAGKCEYCGFIITTGEHDWVLADLSSVKNNANFGMGGVFITDNSPQVGTNPDNSQNNDTQN